MLFISRRVGYSGYGVFDTDDNTEEVRTDDELDEILSLTTVRIKGAERAWKGKLKPGVVGRCSYNPYQDKRSISLLQTKTLALQGVEVKTCGSYITDIRLNNSVPAVLRLSDFGSKCGDLLFYRNERQKSLRLTLIMDDRVRIGQLTFRLVPVESRFVNCGVHGIGVRFDLREVSNLDTRKLIYYTIKGADPEGYRDSILDTSAGFALMQEFMPDQVRK